MLGNLSKIGAVAAIVMIPAALSAQMGGAVNPGVHVGGTVRSPAWASSMICLAMIPSARSSVRPKDTRVRSSAIRRTGLIRGDPHRSRLG
jgi:hypothetical protein